LDTLPSLGEVFCALAQLSCSKTEHLCSARLENKIEIISGIFVYMVLYPAPLYAMLNEACHWL